MKKKLALLLATITVCYFGYAFKISLNEENLVFHPKKEITQIPDLYHLEFQDVFFETKDHLKLHGWFFPANDAQKTLLFFHGNSGNVGSNLELISLFVTDLHVNVFGVDYRGFGKSEGHPSETGLYQDAQAAYEYLTQVRKINKDNIIIFGQSLGGAIAIDLASKRPAGALIVENTFTCALDMARKMYPYLPIQFFIKSRFNSRSKIKTVLYPKLIIHAAQDETVPFRQGEELFKLAPSPKQLYVVPGANHGNNYKIAGPDYVQKLKEFLASL